MADELQEPEVKTPDLGAAAYIDALLKKRRAAAQAHVDALVKAEAKRNPPSVASDIGNAAKGFARSALESSADTVEGLSDAATAVLEPFEAIGDTRTAAGKRADQQRADFTKPGRAIPNFLRDLAGGIPVNPKTAAQGGVAGFLSSTVPEAAGGVLPLMAGGGSAAATAVLGGAAGHTAGKRMGEASDASEAMKGANTYIQTLLGAAAVGGPAGALSRPLGKLGARAVSDFALGAGQNLGAQAGAKATITPEAEIDVGSALESGAALAGVGTGIHGLRAGAERLQRRAGQDQAVRGMAAEGEGLLRQEGGELREDTSKPLTPETAGEGDAFFDPDSGEWRVRSEPEPERAPAPEPVVEAPATPAERSIRWVDAGKPLDLPAAHETSPESLLRANRSEGREVEQPQTAAHQFAEEFARVHGVRAAMDVHADPVSLIYHEAVHQLRRANPEAAVKLLEDIRTADPEGFKRHMGEYEAEFEQATGGKKLAPDRIHEEGMARLTERLSGYITAAFTESDTLRSLLERNPSIVRRIVDKAVQLIQKLGVTRWKTSQQKALISLRVFARGAEEKGYKPNRAAELALKIRDSFRAIEGLEPAKEEAVPGERAQVTEPYQGRPPASHPVAAEAEPIAKVEAPQAAEVEWNPELAVEEQIKAPAAREHLLSLIPEMGHSERGGKLLRNQSGEVIGRTSWAPKSSWWMNRPGKMAAKAVEALVRRVTSDKPGKITDNQRQMLEFLLSQRPERELAKASAQLDEIVRGMPAPDERRVEMPAERARREESARSEEAVAKREAEGVEPSKEDGEEAPFAVAYHGTPHEFDKFDEKKVGTGEGNQTFGHGLYFAEKREVADYYRRGLTNKTFVEKAKDAYAEGDDPHEAEAALLADKSITPAQRELLAALKEDGWLGFDYPHQAIQAALGPRSEFFDPSPRTVEAVKKVGALFEVELAPKEDEYVKWDKPLREQSEKVKAAFDEVPFPKRDLWKRHGAWDLSDASVLYSELVETLGSAQAASDALHEHGVRGIKYLDQSSRGKAEGTSNYVVFKDSDVTITARFAVASGGNKQGFDAPDDTWSAKFRRAIVNDLDRVEVLERAAPTKAPGPETLETLGRLFPGRTFGEVEKLRQQIWKPMKALLRKSKIQPFESKPGEPSASDFLYALAALKANETLAAMNPRKYGTLFNAGSGMDSVTADRIVGEALKGPKAGAYRELRRLNRSLNARRLEAWVSGDLITADQRAELIKKWGLDYVPFRTAEDPAVALADVPQRSKGFNVRGKEFKKREGRSTKADSPLAFAFDTAEQALDRKERNRFGLAIAAWAEANKFPDFLRVESDANKIKDGEFRLSFKKKGEQRWLVTKDKALHDAFKRLAPDPGVIRVFDKALNFLHKTIIAWNPAFPFYNFPKDLGTAAVKVGIEQGVNWSAAVVKNAPYFARGAWKVLRDENAKGKHADLYRDARDAGALVGWNQQFDPTTRLKDFQKSVTRGRTREAIAKLFDFAEDANRAIELGTRLAVYDKAVRSGKTKSEAAILARKVTADFAQRGTWTPIARRLFMFFGAGVQGTREASMAVARHPVRGAAAFGAAMAVGYANAALSRIFADEDENGGSKFDRMSQYQLSHKGGIMVGDQMYGLPLPWFWNVPYYLGVQAEQMLHGERKPGEAFGDVATAALQAMSPIQGPNVGLALTPTLARPAAEIWSNTDYAGSPIRPPEDPYDKTPTPRSEQAFKGINPALQAASRALNRWTGGNSVTEGAISVSPADVEHVIKFLAGGLGANAWKASEVGRKVLAGEGGDVSLPDIPIVRAYVAKPGKSATSQLYYQNIRRTLQAGEEAKAGEKPHEPRLVDLKELASRTDSMVAKLRRAKKDAQAAGEDVKEIEEAMRALMVAFNLEVRKAARGSGTPMPAEAVSR